MACTALTLAASLLELTRPGALYEKLPDNKVRCHACGHRCLILDDQDGVCRVRANRGGVLYVPHGYVSGLAADPVEKKPFFHVIPGAVALSFGMLGCDLHCRYCQNWLTSQTLRDPESAAPTTKITPVAMAHLARQHGADIVTSTYNEPLITSEWARDVFEEARRLGMRTAYVSNGNATEEVLDYLQPWVDFYKVDLKSFDDRHYRQLGGKLDTVLRTIEMLWRKGFWVEVVTLVVPGFNDSDTELRDIAAFLTGISPDIPWHCTAFHPDYRMTDRGFTPAHTLMRACEIGTGAGLRFVYAGNLPGLTRGWEDTRCPQCRVTLIERRGFDVLSYQLTETGACPQCATLIPGRWDAARTHNALRRFGRVDRIPHPVRRY
jgi:pyruvate formate lyase activating enzyme